MRYLQRDSELSLAGVDPEALPSQMLCGWTTIAQTEGLREAQQGQSGTRRAGLDAFAEHLFNLWTRLPGPGVSVVAWRATVRETTKSGRGLSD